MEHFTELLYLVVFIYVGLGVVGYNLLKKLQEILDKLEAIKELIPDGIDKLDAINLKM